MIREIVIKYRDILLFTIGTILIILALLLGLHSRISLVKERVFTEVDYLISKDDNHVQNNEEVQDEIDINTDFVVENEEIEDDKQGDGEQNDGQQENKPSNNKPENIIKKDYIGYLIIPKISLNYGFVAIDSYYNNVDRNIQVIKESNFPDVEGGNLIIAGHSGSGSIAYFKNLYLLKVGDVAKIKYKNKTYTYEIKDIYKEDRDGTITIKRDTTKTTLTLITCSYKDKEHQTVYIAELKNRE